MDKLDSMIHHVHSPLTKFVTNILVHCTVQVLVPRYMYSSRTISTRGSKRYIATSGRDHKENHNTSKKSINNKIINNNTNHLTL